MSQLSFEMSEQPQMITVGDLTRRIRERLEGDPELKNIWVMGEVSNVSRPASGHMYLTLKDAKASLRCVMWRSQVQRLRFLPNAGDQVEALGSIGVYETGGQYQLYLDNIQPAGQGLLYQEYLRLKAALEAEGLFDAGKKRPIPAAPRTIGIVTSPTGAALQDMLNTITRRYPLAEVLLAPTAVQGIDAPPAIVRALDGLNAAGSPDVILVARGGGSIEDLWAFNDEGVVRAIAASPIPVVTGIGHETDFTLSDFAADLRAPTPTAAAELATPDKAELAAALRETGDRLRYLLDERIAGARWALSEQSNRLLRESPEARLMNERQRLDDRLLRISRAADNFIERRRLRLGSLAGRLSGANPTAVLQRGFSIVTDADGNLVASTEKAVPGDQLDVRVKDGKYSVRVAE